MIPLTFEQFYNELVDVLAHPRPWAHMRYGDGEGIVMGYPEYTGRSKAGGRWSKWLGHTDIDMYMFSVKVRESVAYADIVGTPCKRHDKVNQDWRNVKKFLNIFDLIKPDTKTCCMDCTVQLQTSGLYRKLLSGRDSIYYISCRDVDKQLKEKCGIKNIYHKFIPPQARPCKGNNVADKEHFPSMYLEIMEWINGMDIKNQLFLVGAGGLGKIYCAEIKKCGGIALDIGSIFDGWAGLITRSYLKQGAFKL
jgi:hypothetical protein